MIEGIAFTPDSKGVEVPKDKETLIKDNFFFKALLKDGTFSMAKEADKKETEDAKAQAKAERAALVAQANELKLEFPINIDNEKLKALIDKALEQ